MGITSPHRHEQKIMQMKVTSEQAKQLLTDQLSVWESARDNYKALEAVQVKELTVEGCTVKIQFNPARIVSSAAKVDTQSLKERKCFLCAENRPEVQEGLPDGSYTWLINPFPIFPEHFTIPVNEHLPQLIEKRFGDMLRLAQAAEHYVLFYNGPKCGASAPDHAHFQAGNKGFLPLEKELKKYRRIPIRTEKSARLSQVEDYICPFFLIEAESEEAAEKLFVKLYNSHGMKRVNGALVSFREPSIDRRVISPKATKISCSAPPRSIWVVCSSPLSKKILGKSTLNISKKYFQKSASTGKRCTK